MWAIVMAAYWTITNAILGDIHNRYCDEDDIGIECNEDEHQFVILPIFGFICMGV